MVESVTPWNWCTASIICCRKAVGPSPESAVASTCMACFTSGRVTSRYSEFSFCHCSVEICSRTWRAFSRAAMMQETTEDLLEVSKVRLRASS